MKQLILLLLLIILGLLAGCNHSSTTDDSASPGGNGGISINAEDAVSTEADLSTGTTLGGTGTASDDEVLSKSNINCDTGLAEEVKPVISFKMKKPKNMYTFDFTQLTPDDLSLAPRAHYYHGIAQPLIIHFFWCAPVYMDSKRDAWGRPTDQPQLGLQSVFAPILQFDAGYTILKGGDGPLAWGTLMDAHIIGPSKTEKITGDPSGVTCDPYTFETKATSKKQNVRYTFSTRQARQIIDGIDLTYEYMPYGMLIKPGYLHQPCYVHGTINGRPVEALGGFDRGYGLTIYLTPLLNWGDTLVSFSGRGVDGKFEYGWICLSYDGLKPKNSNPRATLAFFHREGEAPVASNDVEIINVTWGAGQGINYGHDIPLEATYRFGGKEIYVKNQWGWYPTNRKDANGKPLIPMLAGITELLGMVGMTDCLGIWREKDSPDFNLSWCGVESYFIYDSFVK